MAGRVEVCRAEGGRGRCGRPRGREDRRTRPRGDGPTLAGPAGTSCRRARNGEIRDDPHTREATKHLGRDLDLRRPVAAAEDNVVEILNCQSGVCDSTFRAVLTGCSRELDQASVVALVRSSRGRCTYPGDAFRARRKYRRADPDDGASAHAPVVWAGRRWAPSGSGTRSRRWRRRRCDRPPPCGPRR